MSLSPEKRFLIILGILAGTAALLLAAYVHRLPRSFLGSNARSTPNILDELPSDASAIVYVDVDSLRKIQGSWLAAILNLANTAPGGDSDYKSFVRDTGFDYTRDLDRAAIALVPQGAGVPNAFAGSQVLALAEGRFDQEKIKRYALRTGRIVGHGGQMFYEVPGNPPVSFLFRSPTRIILASGTNSQNLLLRTSSSGRDPRLQSSMDRVAGAPLFAVARTDHLPKGFYKNFQMSPQLEHLAQSVVGLTLAGQPGPDAMKLALDAECDSLNDALAMATLLNVSRMGAAIAVASPHAHLGMPQAEAALLLAAIRQLKVTQSDRWVRLSLDITPPMVEALARAPARNTPAPVTH